MSSAIASLLLALAVADDGDTVRDVRVEVTPPDAAESEQIGSALADVVGAPRTDDARHRAEARVLAIGRYRSARCRFADPPSSTLLCAVERSRSIGRVTIEGLPISLLETDLKKRVFVRPGESLDAPGVAFPERLARQRERIVEYLERHGYYGARVDGELVRRAKTPTIVDLTLRIRGGAFVRVSQVNVVAHGPLSVAKVKRTFGTMCLSVQGALEAVQTGTVACFTRERLRATEDALELELVERGHPEARVTVGYTPVDPRDPDADDDCRIDDDEAAELRAEGLPLRERCVTLAVKVTAGPRLVRDVVVADADGARVVDDRWPIARFPSWARPTLALGQAALRSVRRSLVEPASRAVQVMLKNDLEESRDTVVYLSDLDAAVTFAEARSVDVQEAEATRIALLAALAERGRTDAEVALEYVTLGDHEVHAFYRVTTGAASAVDRVRFLGNATFAVDEILDEVELSAQPRALLAPGFVGRVDLDDDAARVLAFYEARGFREADVRVEAVRRQNGALDVTFFVDEGERFVLADLVVEGGVPALLPEILAAIAHCRHGEAARAGRAPRATVDCRGAPLLPDELDADRGRVLNVYVANGYPYTRVDVAPDFTEAGAVVRYTIGSTLDEEAPQSVTVGEIWVDGNARTDVDVLLRELDVDTGVPLAPVDVAAGVTRVRRTGLFQRVDLEYLGIEEKKERIDLRMLVEERPSITYDTSLAFSTDRFFSVRNELHDGNVLGRMLDLRLLADLGLFVGRASTVTAELGWPRLLGFPVWLRIVPALVYEDRPSSAFATSPAVDGPVTAGALWHLGAGRRRNLRASNTLSVELRPPETGVIVGLDYEYRIVWDEPSGRVIDPLSLDALTSVDGLVDVVEVDPFRVSTFTPRVSWRRLDDPFDPKNGFVLDASLRLGAPLPELGAAIDWAAIVFNEEWLAIPQGSAAGYTSFLRFTLAGRARAWLGYSYGERGRRSSLLEQNLVAVGGDRTVRGYGQDEIGVRDLPTRATTEDVTWGGHLAIGGAIANVELRYTLVRGFLLGDLSLAAFTDMGLVTDNDPRLLEDGLLSFLLDVDPSDDRADGDAPRLGWGVGTGIRYVLPVGPLSLDFACSPLPRPIAKPLDRCAAHLQLGYTF